MCAYRGAELVVKILTLVVKMTFHLDQANSTICFDTILVNEISSGNIRPGVTSKSSGCAYRENSTFRIDRYDSNDWFCS